MSDVKPAAYTGPDEHGSIYVYLDPDRVGVRGVVRRTTRQHSIDVLLDYDVNGRLVGIELLDLPEDRRTRGCSKVARSRD